ncbi:MAG: phosphoribosyltransferase [Verrucomicrobia bacterium]|nr:phosphoribosyltransferase [Verrucomicrobiota bacterium]
MIFRDRCDAGKQLSEKLQHYKDADAVVIGLVRGGVVVAAEVASALKLPLDVMIVKKVGAPENEELALGAVSEEGIGVFNDHLISLLGVSKEYLRKEIERKKELIKEARKGYLKKHPSVPLKGKTAILVDDGIATGASMKVAIQVAKSNQAARVVLAVPVAAPESLRELSREVDEIICLYAPSTFNAVGAFYKHFSQITDAEVATLLQNE